MQADAATMAWLTVSPLAGLIGAIVIARRLRRRWLPDVDAAGGLVLAAVLVTACWMLAFHLHALLRMAGRLSGLSIPGITVAFLVLLAGVVRVVAREGSREPEAAATGAGKDSRTSRWRWRDAACLLPVGLTHAVLTVEALTRMPSGHDALKYRLPMVVNWLRADALTMKPGVWQLCLPGNGELVLWWLLKAGAERLASAAYLPAGLLLGAAVWAIVRIQHGSRFASALAAAIVLTTHLVAWQMYNGYIDLFGTAFLAAAIVAWLLAVRNDQSRATRRLLWVTAGLATGIALGTKPVNWVLAPFVAVLFIGVYLYRQRRGRDLAFLLPAFVTACLACSGFWFVRAAIEMRNPFYPVGVAIGDRVLLEGARFHTHYEIYESNDKPIALLSGVAGGWADRVVRLIKYAVTLNTLSGDVGPLFATFVPIAMLAVGAGFILRGRRAMRHDRLVVVALTAGVFVLWVGPLCHYARFGMLYLVLAVCVAAPAVGRMCRYWPWAVGVASMTATGLACAVLVAIPVKCLVGRVASRDLSRSAYYGLPDVIDQWPPGTRVVNLTHWSGASTLTYPLYGQGLKNDVIDYMTTQKLFPDLKPSVEQLQNLEVDYVVVCKPFRADWPTDPRLRLVHDDSAGPVQTSKALVTRIYRVPPRLAPDTDRVAAADQPE